MEFMQSPCAGLVGGHSSGGDSAEDAFAVNFFVSLGQEAWLQDFYKPIHEGGLESMGGSRPLGRMCMATTALAGR